MSNGSNKQERTVIEEILVGGGELVARVKKLVEQGNVRRLIIKTPSGKALLDVPLTPAVAVGGTFVILAPLLAVLGTFAALLAEVRVEVVRADSGDGNQD